MSAEASHPDRYAVIGHPIAHSLSPVIHARFAEQTRQHLTYERIDIAPEELAKRWPDLWNGGFRGLNVTAPHKLAVLNLADELSERARVAGAINTLSLTAEGRIRGDNSDGVGLLRDLERNQGHHVQGQRVLLLGAGGASRGVLGPLLSRRPTRLVLANRTVLRAREMAAAFAAVGPVTACGYDELPEEPFDLVLNATAAGLSGRLPPVPAGVFQAGTLAYDLMYARTETPFCRWARAQGALAVDGLGMLIEQAAESFFLWRKVRPTTTTLLAGLRDLIPA